MFTQLYHTILYQPIFNLLVWFYNIIPLHDIGIAIILITIVIKIVLYPFSVKSIKAQKALQELQPKMEEIRQKFKDNPQEMTKATMALYKQEKISPFSSCLPLIIQLPFFVAVYSVFRKGLTNNQNLDILYSFVQNPGQINTWFIGLIDLAKANIILAVLAGLAQYWVSKMLITKKQPAVATAKDEDMAAKMNKQMLYFMPLMTIFIGFSLPAGLTLYWFVSTLLTGIQQLYLFKKKVTLEIIDKK
ncbi:MAG TPA: YidC/Oxa1 family membrane protein insertase [bacterium]|nr:YidC/Oxa1 family membrane protein insertase [bacterium]